MCGHQLRKNSGQAFGALAFLAVLYCQGVGLGIQSSNPQLVKPASGVEQAKSDVLAQVLACTGVFVLVAYLSGHTLQPQQQLQSR